jgi:CHAD domain-containing protein
MADGKWIGGLTPDMAVVEAAAVVLAARFEVVRYYLPLAADKPFDDPEYVHQLRVGTRRATAALRAFDDCLPRKHRRSIKRALRAIRRSASDARDWDVFLLALESSPALRAASSRPARDFLSGYALGERAAEQIRLSEAAASNGPTFMEESALLPTVVHHPKGDSPPENFGNLAAVRLGSLLAEFTDAAVANPNDPAALHRLRILGKRLRYSLEIMAGCFPPTFRTVLYPAIEQLQEHLGGIQDAAVALERLAQLRERTKKARPRDWSRFARGFEAQMKSLRAAMTSGRKAFQKWRREWATLVRDLKVEIVAATIAAK